MKEAQYAREIIETITGVLDCIEGKKPVNEVLTFRGSHLVDNAELEKRMSGLAKPYSPPVETKPLKAPETKPMKTPALNSSVMKPKKKARKRVKKSKK